MRNGEEIKSSLLKDIKLLSEKATKYIRELYDREKELDKRIEQKNKELDELQNQERILRKRLEGLQSDEIEANFAKSAEANKKKSMTKMWSINFLSNDTYRCPFCKGGLIYDHISLAYFGSLASKTIKGFIRTNSLFCIKCNQHFINPSMKSEINRKIIKNYIKENTPENNQTNTPSYINAIERHLNKEDKQTSTCNKEYFDDLNSESQLHKLGYNVSKLDKEERWRTLKYKVLRKMTVEEVISQIEYNISLRQGYSKYASAIAAWKYDIQRLKEFKKTGG